MLRGKAHRFGDDVDTDVIIPAKYLTSTDADVLKAHCMEGVEPGFAQKVSPGDVLVAGGNFGCGSSREHAPLCIKAAGVSCVIAGSFARIFFRNSFNIGLPILESREASQGIEAGDEVEVDLAAGVIKNLTKATEFQARAVPDFMQELIADGGLIGRVQKLLREGRIGGEGKGATTHDQDEEPKPEPGARMKELEQEAAPAGRDAPWEEESESQPAAPADAEEEDEDEEDEDEQA